MGTPLHRRPSFLTILVFGYRLSNDDCLPSHHPTTMCTVRYMVRMSRLRQRIMNSTTTIDRSLLAEEWLSPGSIHCQPTHGSRKSSRGRTMILFSSLPSPLSTPNLISNEHRASLDVHDSGRTFPASESIRRMHRGPRHQEKAFPTWLCRRLQRRWSTPQALCRTL